MDMQLNETQEMLRASAREFLAESCPTKKVREMRALPEGFSRDLWREMGGLGWLGLALPESAGGSDMPFLDLCLLIEELGRACVPSPFVEAVAGAAMLLGSAKSAAAKEVLGAAVMGEMLVVPAFTGSDDEEGNHHLPVVRREGGSLVVNGCIGFVPYAAAASHLLCLARSADPTEGAFLLLVPTSEKGVEVRPLHSWRDERPCHVTLNSLSVPEDALVACGDEADKLVRRALERMDIARCYDVCGALSWVMDDTVSYAKDRKQFGQPIGSFQVLQHYCADMHVMLEGLKMGAAHAAWRLSQELEASHDVAVACAYAHMVIPKYLGIAHQIHGAMGVTIEHDLQLYSTHAFAPARRVAAQSEYLEAALMP